MLSHQMSFKYLLFSTCHESPILFSLSAAFIWSATHRDVSFLFPLPKWPHHTWPIYCNNYRCTNWLLLKLVFGFIWTIAASELHTNFAAMTWNRTNYVNRAFLHLICLHHLPIKLLFILFYKRHLEAESEFAFLFSLYAVFVLYRYVLYNIISQIVF